MDVFHHKNIKNQQSTVREVMSAFRTDGSSRDVVFLVGDQQLSYHSQVLTNAFPLLRTLMPNVSTNMCPCEAYTSKSACISITLEDVSLKIVERIMLTVYDPTKLMYFSQKDITEVKALLKMLGADMCHYSLVDSNSSLSRSKSNNKNVMLKNGVTSEEEILISADVDMKKEIEHEEVNISGTLSEHVPYNTEPEVPYQTADIESEETRIVEMNQVLNHQEIASSFSNDIASSTCSYSNNLTNDVLEGGDSLSEIVQGKETERNSNGSNEHANLVDQNSGDDFDMEKKIKDIEIENVDSVDKSYKAKSSEIVQGKETNRNNYGSKKHVNLVDQNGGDDFDMEEKLEDNKIENEDSVDESYKVKSSVVKVWSEKLHDDITSDQMMEETNLEKVTDVLLDNETNCVDGSDVSQGPDGMEVKHSSTSKYDQLHVGKFASMTVDLQFWLHSLKQIKIISQRQRPDEDLLTSSKLTKAEIESQRFLRTPDDSGC